MNSIGKTILTVLGCFVVSIALATIPTRPVSAAPGGPTVTVGNTPLPVTGSVNANVSGNVGISGTPTVNINSMPAVNLNGGVNATIANTAASPVPTSNVPGSPFDVQAQCGVDDLGYCGLESILSIPVGQVAIVRYVSFDCYGGSAIELVNLQNTASPQHASPNDFAVNNYLNVSGSATNSIPLTFGQNVNLYIPGVESGGINLVIKTNATSGGSCSGTISGNMAPMPVAQQ